MRKHIVAMAILLFCLVTVISIVFAQIEDIFKLQEPKGDTEELTYFEPSLIKFNFEIKYPAAWYVREEIAGNILCLFFTREPIRKEGDRYTVGASLLYNVNYFVSKEPADSALGQAAETVIKMRNWEESKSQFIDGLEEGGNNIISKTDVTISDQPAFRVEYESKSSKIATIYIKAGINLLTMTFEAPAQEYDQYKDTFEKILSSLFFTR